ncbi:unnamed protein product [Rotaria magnacalcarata]|uniref:Calmodulin-binding domain-containing protein n=1 Tax=Rotaria magnacalcarata TaxID=392030 RepID=A0A819JYV6_9BILA|nr:unnamed protein product [Rotaria magnacalcarata]
MLRHQINSQDEQSDSRILSDPSGKLPDFIGSDGNSSEVGGILGIAATTGIIGVFSTALLVAVIAQKLELTRSEKYVHNFVANIELAKAHKDQAANVVKYGWKVWYLRRKGKANFIQYIQTQRKLLTSIHLIRSIKQRQRKLADNYVSLMEIFTVQRSTSAVTDETAQRVIFMERKIDKVEDKLIEINQGMINLEDKLNILLDRITKK